MQTVQELNDALKAPRPAGRLVSRFCRGLCVAKGDPAIAVAYMERRRWAEATICKAAIGAMAQGDTAIAGSVGNDLVELTRRASVVDRLPFRRAPMRTNGVLQNARSTAFWGMGEGVALPASALSFADGGQLLPHRVGSLSVVTSELAQSSSPAADDVVARDLGDAVVRALDRAAFDPSNSGSPELEPASLASGAPLYTSTGNTASAITSDIRKLMLSLVNNGSDLQSAVFVMHPRTAVHLTTLGEADAVFRGMRVTGGELAGLPVYVTDALPIVGSPDSTYLLCVDASGAWFSDEGGAQVASSRNAHVQMDTAPTGDAVAGSGSALVSMFQTESIAIKASRFVSWRVSTPARVCAALVVEY